MDFRALLLVLALSSASAAPNPDEIIRKSVEAMKSDWAQNPK
jgi:hypothetical protein